MGLAGAVCEYKRRHNGVLFGKSRIRDKKPGKQHHSQIRVDPQGVYNYISYESRPMEGSEQGGSEQSDQEQHSHGVPRSIGRRYTIKAMKA